MFVLNIPNMLTIIRMVLVPVFVVLYRCEMRTMAFVVYVVASLTDMADGYLARRLNQITSFGKLMDPLADKLMQISMMICLVSTGNMPWWALCILLVKEVIMIIGGSLLLKKRNVVVKSNWSGKTATVLLILAIVCLFPWHGVDAIFSIGRVLLYVGLAVSVFSMFNYYMIYVKKPGRQTAD